MRMLGSICPGRCPMRRGSPACITNDQVRAVFCQWAAEYLLTGVYVLHHLTAIGALSILTSASVSFRLTASWSPALTVPCPSRPCRLRVNTVQAYGVSLAFIPLCRTQFHGIGVDFGGQEPLDPAAIYSNLLCVQNGQNHDPRAPIIVHPHYRFLQFSLQFFLRSASNFSYQESITSSFRRKEHMLDAVERIKNDSQHAFIQSFSSWCMKMLFTRGIDVVAQFEGTAGR